MGRGILALGCICILYFKCSLSKFWIVKKKMLHGLLHNLYMNQVISWKPKFSCGLGKKEKICANIRFTHDNFFVFLHRALKLLVYHETLSYSHRMSRCARTIFFNFFSYFEMSFLDKGSTCIPNQMCIFEHNGRDSLLLERLRKSNHAKYTTLCDQELHIR
jgi:hypothetical protein